MATNLVTYELSAAAVTARNAEFTGTPLTDTLGDGTYADPYLGCNRAGSCAPAIGVNTGSVFLTAAEQAAGVTRPEAWTQLDQAEAARIPQASQHIGGIVDTAPEYEGVEYPSPAQAGSTAVNILDMTVGSVDSNDTANFVVTDTAAADGAVMDTVSGAINDTGATVGIGDLVWGKVPVA